MKPMRPPKTARHAAIGVLCQLDRSARPLSRLFDHLITDAGLSAADRQLCMNICYGVLRNRQDIEHLLKELCKKPLSKIMPFAYHALCCGVFQLLFLDRIPPSAAINETVKAAVSEGLPRPVTGFINAVLRACNRRQSTALQTPLKPGKSRSFLNHPDWLTNRWAERFGHQRMKQICQTNNQQPTLQLRCCSGATVAQVIAMISEKGITALPGNYSEQAVILPDYRGQVTALPGYASGMFMVQDQAAQLATLLLGPFTENQQILDCCAGSGGKTIHLSQLRTNDKAPISALEPAPYRYRQLAENLQRTAATARVKTYRTTLQRFSRSTTVRFDSVLVDAPCSGTGVIRRNPDIRWYRQERTLNTYHLQQLTLLEQAASLVTPGGVLVYATCSIEQEENDQVVATFLTNNKGFYLTDAPPFLPEPARVFVRNGCFAPLPGEDIDGFFAARLQRKS